MICEGLKIAHADGGEVGERFVEKMVSLGWKRSPGRGGPPSSQTSVFSARVRHEQKLPGN